MRNNRQGCLAGLLELFFLEKLFAWLQRRFGFGHGASCTGVGCGFILLLAFVAIACSFVTHTNWFRLF